MGMLRAVAHDLKRRAYGEQCESNCQEKSMAGRISVPEANEKLNQVKSWRFSIGGATMSPSRIPAQPEEAIMGDSQPVTSSAQVPPAAVLPEDARSQRRTIFIVFLVVFVDLFGFGIIFPLLPRYAEEFLDPLIPGGKEARLGGFLLGLLMASFSAMQFLFAPLWGRVSDRVGRRPILVLGLVGSVVFYALFGIASGLGTEGWRLLGLILLFVSRIGAGIAGATVGTAQAAIADSTTPEGRARGMALIGVAFGLGFTFGPLLGVAALLLFPDFRGAVGFAAAACSLTGLLLALAFLPETLRPGSVATREDFWQGLWTCVRRPSIGLLLLIFFTATIAFAGFEATLSLLTNDALGFSDRINFLLFSYIGVVLMLSQGALYQVLSRVLHVQEITFILVGNALMGVGMAGLAATAWLALGTEGTRHGVLVTTFMISLACVAVGFAFLIPSIQALQSRRCALSEQGAIAGVNQSASALARILGPILGLSLYRFPPAHVLPNALGAGIIAVVLLLTFRARKD
jgi:MFS family permease